VKDVLPELSMDVVIGSIEIQDAEPIRSALMSETAATSRGELELLGDDGSSELGDDAPDRAVDEGT
jgi:hypothetical protein